jgi:hypothetical protein
MRSIEGSRLKSAAPTATQASQLHSGAHGLKVDEYVGA